MISLSAPVLASLIVTPDSELDVRYIGAASGRAHFLATNTGSRAGSVTAVRMELREQVSGIRDARTAWDFGIDPVVVPAGSVRKITVSLADEPTRIVERIAYRHFENADRERPLPVPRIRLAALSRSFADQEPRWSGVEPSLMEMLRAGGGTWDRCLAALPTSAWNGDPTSHVIPEQMGPGFVESRCGPPPASALAEPDPSTAAPRPSAGLP